MKTLLVCVATVTFVASLAGCATLFTSPTITVQPASAPSEKWTITGTIHPQAIASNMFTGELSVYINDKVVASGPVGGSPTNIKGTYGNHTIQTVCPAGGETREHSFSCQVYVDGTLTAVLPFG